MTEPCAVDVDGGGRKNGKARNKWITAPTATRAPSLQAMSPMSKATASRTFEPATISSGTHHSEHLTVACKAILTTNS